MIMREQLLCGLFVTFTSYAYCKVNEDATAGTKCLKDTSFGENYPVNIYYCDDDAFPTCCQRDFTYDCCEDETEKNWREQLILWGSVSAVIVLILLVCMCFWKEDLCGGKSPCKKWKEKRDAKKYEEKKPLDDSDEVVSSWNTPGLYQSTSPPLYSEKPVDQDSGRHSAISGTSSYQSQQHPRV